MPNSLRIRRISVSLFVSDVADLPSIARGVGHDPDAIPLVKRTNGVRGNALPFRVIPERGQVPENVSHRASSVDSQEV
jgi:hypothetical protein